MQPNELQETALTQRTARTSRKPIKTWPKLDPDNAFEVQRISANHATNNGDKIVGYKLGNVAKVMQDAFGLDKPEYGFLLASTFVYERITLWREQYIKPYVELEPAFVLGGHLRGPNVTVVDVINAIEVIDSRVKNWEIGLADTLADNGPTGSVILGGTPRRLTQRNLRDTWGSLQLNDRELMAGNTSNVLGNPLSVVAWLVNRLVAYDIELTLG